ncbi:MAG: MFS transporter [Leptolyngbyaceae cyanobacterium SM1_3_5]|nr:MFS transporter [Leptolyngbyaceae cyanobacterium SM1_3_5]
MPLTSLTSIRAFSPLRHRGFRQIWIAMLIANIALWMQSIAAAWLMTSLSSSPLLVSLLQTAASFPAFLIGLPAGALADIFDRPKLLAWAQGWTSIVAGSLGLLAVANVISPENLLIFTFLAGLGTALGAPVWGALIPEVTPHEELPEALTLYGSGIDLSRAIGPVLAGAIVAISGPGVVFLITAGMGFYLIVALHHIARQTPHSEVMPERVVGALRAGGRYVRHAPPLQVVLLRTGLFMLCGSGLWALLPALSRYELGIDSEQYGLLFGAMGFGSIVATLVLPTLNQTFSRDAVVLFATVVYALMLFGLSQSRSFAVLCLLMGITGIAWTVLMASFSVAVQMVVPDWVRARSLSFFQFVLQGNMAIGALLWGAIATYMGTSRTLALTALCLGISLIAAFLLRFRDGEHLNLTPAHPPFHTAVAVDPQPEDGPVLVMLQYDIQIDRIQEFVETIQPLRLSRERDGVTRWDLWQDVSVWGRFVECFIVESWAEHCRQFSRFTISDQELEDRVRSCLQNQEAIAARFFIFARPKRIIPPLQQTADDPTDQQKTNAEAVQMPD